MLNRLFVYGTLAPGRPNAHVLENILGEWAKGSVRGQLVQEGWGARQGYPGVVLDDNAGRVDGFMLTSDFLRYEWARLDEFEGTQYERVVVQVQLEDGRALPAFIYQIKP